MKKLLLIAALVAAALVGRAQTVADSLVAAIVDTNTEIMRIERDLKTHSIMVAGGGVTMAAGLLFAVNQQAGNDGIALHDATRLRTGLVMTAIGATVVALSFIPIARHGVKVDGRGLVIHPSELRKK